MVGDDETKLADMDNDDYQAMLDDMGDDERDSIYELIISWQVG